MTSQRTILHVEEEKIEFINKFLIEQCLKVDPNVDLNTLAETKKLTAIEVAEEQFQYFYNGKIPLLFIDLKLLIDGV
jgi:hypothetical protein